MSDSIVNNGIIGKQVNIGENSGLVCVGNLPSRWAVRFARLHEEISSEIRRNGIIDELLEYRTKLDGTKGLEAKLEDGNIPLYVRRNAVRQKEKYAKMAERFVCYEAAQQIDLELFVFIKDRFDVYVFPQILQSAPASKILQIVQEQVVQPAMNIIWTEGAYDNELNYTEDTIYGMLYYLTGMCHLNWKDYDNV